MKTKSIKDITLIIVFILIVATSINLNIKKDDDIKTIKRAYSRQLYLTDSLFDVTKKMEVYIERLQPCPQ